MLKRFQRLAGPGKGLLAPHAQNQEDIKKALAKFKDLPTLPDVVAKVMRIVSNPLTTADDLNQVIFAGPGPDLQGAAPGQLGLLRLPQEITTITQAVSILGFNTIRNLALSISVHKDALFRRGKAALFAARILEALRLGGGLLQDSAKRVGYKSEDNAFTAGLLHDIGKSVLDRIDHEGFLKALQASQDGGRPLWECEREFCGVDHAYVGGSWPRYGACLRTLSPRWRTTTI